MVRRLVLAVAFAAALASPAPFDMLWSWAASLAQEEPAPPPPPTTDDGGDQGYGIDPDG